MPFQPAGERARWRTAYDTLRTADVGDIVTYQQLGEALSLDPITERQKIQMAVRRAAQEYLTADQRALQAVTDEGYRVADASGHLALARQHQSRASKQLAKGHATATHVDLSNVDPATRTALIAVAQAFALQMDFNRRFDVRQKRLEEALSQVTERTDRSETEIAELRARLEKLEQPGQA
jgi:hypothetical protein